MSESTHSLLLDKASSQYAKITDGAQTGLDIAGDFTIEGWIKLDGGAGADQYLLAGKWNTVGNNASYYLYYETIGYPSLTARISTDGSTIYTALYGTNLGSAWHHVAVTWDQSKDDVYFYVDGTCLNPGAPESFGTTSAIYNGTADFGVGGLTNSLPFYMDGRIDEVRIWNVVRTPAEMVANYQALLTGGEDGLQGYWHLDNNYTDETANGNDLTGVNSPAFSTDVPDIWSHVPVSAIRNRLIDGGMKFALD